MSEIQEAYGLLQEIDSLLAGIEARIANIEGKRPQLEATLQTFRDLERLALRWLVVARRMGLPEDVEAATNKIARLIVSFNMMQMGFTNLLSGLATGNVFAVAMGTGGLIAGGLSYADSFAGY